MHIRTHVSPGARYNAWMTLRFLGTAILALLFSAALPLFVYAQAQSQDDLHAAIMAELLRDPRTANIPPAQLQVLVDALAQKAQVQNVSASDIRWHPQSTTGLVSQDQSMGFYPSGCADGFSSLCSISDAYGFSDESPTIPLALLVSSGLLILLIVRMIRHHQAMPASQTTQI